ncbi:MAG TPA: serine/threonine-protein kinase [Kofleriaceae bacterium]|nr:serine/threonine-protein kinase [Kofleriaceae bacterium]
MDPQPGPDLLIGQTIGNYLVTQKLGEGGMGSVYLAEHPAIGKKVALKVLHSEFSTNQEVAARFFHEAKAVNDIGHPNIVDIVDFGIIQAGPGREQLVYFIMEYLAGFTLSQLIRSEAPLPPERALTIALQVADALSASHRCGIVHRDLKPDNIILLQRGRERDFVKLLDFGIAKLTGDAAMGSHRTRTGIVMGTPAYMSPEQCEGRGTVDRRTDVYALGIVIYEMLTGRVPFLGDGYGEVLVQHLTQRPTPVSQFRMLPAHVEIVVMKALEKRPDLRYPTMEEFMRAMSDPVGYVEAQGGIGGFLQRQLMPSSAPITTSVRLTPGPLTPGPLTPGPLTPLPGTLSGAGIATPAPTTLGSSVGQLRPPRGTAPWLRPAMIGVLAATVIGIVFVIGFGGKTHAVAGDGSASAGSAIAGPGSAGGPGGPGGPGGTTPDPGTAGSGAVARTAGSDGPGSAAGSGSATAQVAANPPEVGSDAHPGSDAPRAGSDGGSGGSAAAEADIDLLVSSTPPGARIFVDGTDTGKLTPSPLIFPSKMKGKRVAIALHLKGFTTLSSKVEVGASGEQQFELKAKAEAPPPPRCRTAERAGCTRDGKGCCLPEAAGQGTPPGHGSGTKQGSAKQDPDGLMKPD